MVTDHHPDRRDPALAIAVDGNAILIMPTGPSSSDDDYETIHTTTPLAVPAGRHDIRLTAHATEILISSIRVTPSTAS